MVLEDDVERHAEMVGVDESDSGTVLNEAVERALD
jgi:hypothetical protein